MSLFYSFYDTLFCWVRPAMLSIMCQAQISELSSKCQKKHSHFRIWTKIQSITRNIIPKEIFWDVWKHIATWNCFNMWTYNCQIRKDKVLVRARHGGSRYHCQQIPSPDNSNSEIHFHLFWHWERIFWQKRLQIKLQPLWDRGGIKHKVCSYWICLHTYFQARSLNIKRLWLGQSAPTEILLTCICRTFGNSVHQKRKTDVEFALQIVEEKLESSWADWITSECLLGKRIESEGKKKICKGSCISEVSKHRGKMRIAKSQAELDLAKHI